MRFLRSWALVLAVMLCVNMVACIGGKKESKAEPPTFTTTLGQELLDLDKAYKDGIPGLVLLTLATFQLIWLKLALFKKRLTK